jgi:RimJ/RimL family protein N-acetyltransferase
LEGHSVNLKVVGRETLQTLIEWSNDPDFKGAYVPLRQISPNNLEKWYEGLGPNEEWFVIEKKNGSKVGYILCSPAGAHYQLTIYLLPIERQKGYGTEAVKIMLDYLFLSRDIVRVQTECDSQNVAYLKTLRKAGFKQEGVMRRYMFVRGEWKDTTLLSVLREEWKAPRSW